MLVPGKSFQLGVMYSCLFRPFVGYEENEVLRICPRGLIHKAFFHSNLRMGQIARVLVPSKPFQLGEILHSV